jgi:hypothetical protein
MRLEMTFLKIFGMGFFALANAAGAATSLDSRLQSGSDGWAAYDVPMVEGAGTPCCFDGDHETSAKVCNLDGHNWSFGTRDHQAAPTGPGVLSVYVHRQGGKADRVRAIASTCGVRADTPVARLGDADAADSAQWLQQWIGTHAKHSDVDSALAALAYQAGPQATQALDALGAAQAPQEQRKNAIFWLGQTRGRDGATIVERYARHDGDAEVREHAVFSLSQAKAIDGYAVIYDIAQHDASRQVRSQSLFWMAQTGDARAAKDIRAAIGNDTDPEVREQGVFALSQIHPGGDAALIDILRSDVSRDVKEKAMFWLGQSGSDEAIRFIDQALASTKSER